MINKYIKIEQGTYRNQDMSGRIFPILKDYQRFAGKEGGFVTVDCSELDGFEGLDKARINVPAITDLTIVTEGQYQMQRDELKTDTITDSKDTGEETDEQAIDRIAARFEILDEMAEAVSTSKVRAMIVSGPPGIGKSYGVERALEKRSMFDDIAGSSRKFEVVKGAMSPIGLYKKLYEHSAKGHVVCFDDCDAILYDDLALNLLKAALDTGKKRTLHWNTESRTLMAEGMPNQFETNASVLSGIRKNDQLGRPEDYYAQLAGIYRAVDAKTIGAAATEYLQPTGLTFIVVGDRKIVEPQLKDLGIPVEVRAAPASADEGSEQE